jgi:hypothetical protein
MRAGVSEGVGAGEGVGKGVSVMCGVWGSERSVWKVGYV